MIEPLLAELKKVLAKKEVDLSTPKMREMEKYAVGLMKKYGIHEENLRQGFTDAISWDDYPASFYITPEDSDEDHTPEQVKILEKFGKELHAKFPWISEIKYDRQDDALFMKLQSADWDDCKDAVHTLMDAMRIKNYDSKDEHTQSTFTLYFWDENEAEPEIGNNISVIYAQSDERGIELSYDTLGDIKNPDFTMYVIPGDEKAIQDGARKM